MKHSLKIDTLEFKIKLIISASLLFFLILSFFFAKNIELALGFRSNGSLGQVDYEAISGSNFYVEYLDVGQGNCSFVRLPDGKTILIDSGSDMYAETVEEFLKGRGVSTLDYVIATHADADHIGAFSYLFDKFEVKNVLRPFQIAGTGTNLENFEVYKDEDLAAAYNLIVEREGKSNSISRVTTVAYKNFITSIYSETYLEGNERKSCSVSVFYDGLATIQKPAALRPRATPRTSPMVVRQYFCYLFVAALFCSQAMLRLVIPLGMERGTKKLIL